MLLPTLGVSLMAALVGYLAGCVRQRITDLKEITALQAATVALEKQVTTERECYLDLAALYRAAVRELPPPASRAVMIAEVARRLPQDWRNPVTVHALPPRTRMDTTGHCSRPTLDFNGWPLFPTGETLV